MDSCPRSVCLQLAEYLAGLVLSTEEPESVQVPVARGLWPARVSVGGLEPTLQVSGYGLVPGTTVRIDGVARTTLQNNGAMVEVALTPEDLAAPHTAKVTLHAPDGTSSLPLLPTSDPMLSRVERMAALNNVPQWLSTSSSRPA